MTRARRLLPAVVAATVVLGASAAPAQAAPTWLPEVTAADADNDSVQIPDVVVDAAGNATATWLRDGVEELESATRPAGAADFGPVQSLGPADVRHVELVGHPDGAVTIVFVRGEELMATTRPAGVAVFPDAEPIVSRPPGFTWEGAAVAVDGSGRLTATWAVRGPSGDDDLIATSTRAANSVTWSVPEELADGLAAVVDLAAAADSTGAVTIAWLDDVKASAATRLAGSGTWQVQTLADDQDTLYVAMDLAVRPDGRAAVAIRTDNNPDGAVALLRRTAAGQPFGAPVALAAPGVGYGPLVELDAEGRATVAWIDGAHIVRVGIVEPVGSVTQAALSEPDAYSDLLASTIDSLGAVTLAWSQDVGNVPITHVSRRPAGGSFAAPVALSDPTLGQALEHPAVAAAPDGDVTVVHDFSSDARSLTTVFSQVLDVAGPRVSLAVGSAVAGSPSSLTAQAVDRWSNPATFTWDFGDGGSAAGATASHVYAAAGSYVVTVTATDAVGNATTLTRTVVVASAKDTTAPVLSKARLRPDALPTGHGTKLSVTTTESAALVGVVQRRRNGEWRQTGAKRWSVQAGENTKTFFGKVEELRLRSGRYRVVLTATDAAGNSSSRTTLRFSVDRD